MGRLDQAGPAESAFPNEPLWSVMGFIDSGSQNGFEPRTPCNLNLLMLHPDDYETISGARSGGDASGNRDREVPQNKSTLPELPSRYFRPYLKA